MRRTPPSEERNARASPPPPEATSSCHSASRLSRSCRISANANRVESTAVWLSDCGVDGSGLPRTTVGVVAPVRLDGALVVCRLVPVWSGVWFEDMLLLLVISSPPPSYQCSE
ncbi:hypothetical protein GGH99_006123 [Coemansia sp. RSA 1285]|nr:hypothetical protein GGH99_006123 [Coemansia sp. RSA 1285]